MIINDIPLGRLKEILATDTPLAIETTEALITRLEQAEENLESALEANKHWAHRSSRERSELFKANASIERVRALRNRWCDASYDPTARGLGIAGAVNAIDYALDGEQS